MRSPLLATPRLCLCLCLAGCAGTVASGGDAPGADPANPSEPDDLPPEAEVTGSPRIVIVDEHGAPVPDAAAVLIDQGYSLRLGTAERPLRADADGAIALDAPIDEERIVLAWAPGRAAARLELPSIAGEHRVVLGEPTPLRGRVAPSRSGRVAQVWLHATDPAAPWPYFVRCDVDESGGFRADGLAAGTFTVASVPIGGAPVLAADADGATLFLAADPGSVSAVDHRFLDRAIAADGTEHVLRVAFGEATVRGRVVDEQGAPIAGASLRLLTESGREASGVTDATGSFSIGIAPAPSVHVMAAHPDFGEQWTDYELRGWSYNDAIPEQPVELVLRRGVVLRGVVRGVDGRPFANRPLILVPAYVGSGPPTEETRTDASGHFAFERMLLHHFELVPESLRNWSVTEAGRYLRVAHADREGWVRAAEAGRPVELALEAFERVPVTVEVGAGTPQVELWARWGPELYTGSVPTVRRGRVQLTMERGVRHELWVDPYREGEPMTAPWSRNERPDWSGTPDGPLQLRITPD